MSTAASALRTTPTPPTPSPAEERKAIRAMLRIPRPRTRGECLEEARPCPWVGCKHHLLLGVARPLKRQDGPSRAPGLVLNVPTTGGRRPHQQSSCDADAFEAWSDEVLDVLIALPWSCELDAIDALGAMSVAEVGELLGLGNNRARKESTAALRRWARNLVAQLGADPDKAPGARVLAHRLKAALAT